MLKLNIKKIDETIFSVVLDKTLVFLGANGTGKTHLAMDIYNNQFKNNSYLIGAHKDLSLPKNIQLFSLEEARKIFYFGQYGNGIDFNRWRYDNLNYEDRSSGIISDFTYTLSYMFAKQYRDVNNCISDMRTNPDKLRVPEDFIIEKVQKIWNSLISHKKIKLSDGSIFIEDLETNTSYSGTTLSDGEKHLLYLITQVLCCDYPILIIDEPEHYLNKAILSKLWDLLEDERKDIKFIYITHDIDFALSREDSKKIWLKKFIKSKESWDFEEILSDDNLSDKLILNILGDKKKILFTEGEKNGYEERLFSLIFEDHKVIPIKTCHDVIKMINSIEDKKYSFLKEYSFTGIIDRDYLSESYIEDLKNKNIHILSVAEIENLFITSEVINVFCDILKENPNTLSKLKSRLFEEATKILDDQVINCLKSRLKNSIQNINISKKAKEEDSILRDLSQKTKNILDNISNDYNVIKGSYSNVLKEQDYEELLKIFNYKGFLSLANNILEATIAEKILNLMSKDKNHKENFSREFLKYIPNL